MNPILKVISNPFKFGKTRAVLLGIGMVIGMLIWLAMPGQTKSAAATPTKPQLITVDTATVTHRDMPIYLEGLGTVQAFNTVTVTARVDGQLQQIGFVEGQTVKKGDFLAQIDPRLSQASLELAIANRDKDVAQLENAHHDLDRYRVLAPQDLASKQTLDAQTALVAELQAQIKADQAAIDNARTQLDYTRITSPINGRTGIRLVDVGNNVHGTDATGIVIVTQVQPVSLIFTLPEEDLVRIREAQARGKVDISALSRDGKTVLDQGTLALIDNLIDQATGTIKLKATFPNSRNMLWPGQFINARILLQVQRDAMVIPSTAQQRGPDGMFVYVVKADSTVEARSIKTGIETDNTTLVESGLEIGEHVVISNQYRLQPGTVVRIAKPDAKAAAESLAP